MKEKEIQAYNEKVYRARKAHEDGNLFEAIRILEDATAEFASVDDLIDLGIYYIENGEYSSAQELFGKILADFPENYRAHLGMGISFEEQGLFQEALESYRKAHSYNKKDDTITFLLARMYESSGNLNSAEDFYQLTTVLNEKNSEAYLNLGVMYLNNNKLEAALEMFQKAYDLDNNQPFINFNLGLIYMKKGEYEKAVEYYLNEVSLENGLIWAYYNLGLVYKDNFKDYNSAKYYLLKGLQKEKDNLAIWYNLGCLHVILKEYDDAYNCFFYVMIKEKTVVCNVPNDNSYDQKNSKENKNIIELIEDDSELVEFLKTEQFLKLKSEFEKIRNKG